MTLNVTLAQFKALGAADLIVDSVASCDTIELVFFPALSEPVKSSVKALNAGRLKFRPTKKRKSPFRKQGEIWHLQRPTREVLLHLHEVERARPGFIKVYRVDICVDFMCRSKKDAETVRNFLGLHMRQKWSGKSVGTTYKNTTYARPASKGRNVVFYADKPSKVTDDPCAHLEFRFNTFRKCREKGFHDLFRLAQGVDAMELLKREARLDVISQNRFEKALERSARTLKRQKKSFENWHVDDLQEKLAAHVAVMMQNESGTVVPGRAENIRVSEAFRRVKVLRGAMEQMKWEEFTLPPRWVHHCNAGRGGGG